MDDEANFTFVKSDSLNHLMKLFFDRIFVLRTYKLNLFNSKYCQLLLVLFCICVCFKLTRFVPTFKHNQHKSMKLLTPQVACWSRIYATYHATSHILQINSQVIKTLTLSARPKPFRDIRSFSVVLFMHSTANRANS